MKEWVIFGVLAGVFLLLVLAPVSSPVVVASIASGLVLLQEYARDHVLTCLVPAFFIAGTIAVYVRKTSIMRLLGPRTSKWIAYPVASISGGILAVCSCTILPLFTGIYRRGAGLGPAVAFLFTGPAINVTAIVLTGGVVGWDFAVGRLLASLVISVLAGVFMASVFSSHDATYAAEGFAAGLADDLPYSGTTVAIFLAVQLAVLVTFGLPLAAPWKAGIVVILLAAVAGMVLKSFRREHTAEWLRETWVLTKQILPLLLVGVFLAGIIGVAVPAEVVTGLVGRNTLPANLVASTFGAFMYFATLTEVPIIQKLLGLGMGRGPALTLFLTGNALSLPSMIVLFRVMGKRQAPVYIITIILLSAAAGWLFGEFF